MSDDGGVVLGDEAVGIRPQRSYSVVVTVKLSIARLVLLHLLLLLLRILTVHARGFVGSGRVVFVVLYFDLALP